MAMGMSAMVMNTLVGGPVVVTSIGGKQHHA